MRRILTLAFAVAVMLALASPAAAERAEFRFTGPDGTERATTIADVAYLNAPCQESVPSVDTGDAVTVHVAVAGQHREPFEAVAADGSWIGLFGDPPAPCLLRAELASALEHARPHASTTAPWLAMIVTMGALALVILLVILWGAGRGPEPELTPARQPGHDHTGPEHADHAQPDPDHAEPDHA